MSGKRNSENWLSYVLSEEPALPCDVHLPPATVIRKGVKLSVLLRALSIRARTGKPGGMRIFPTEPSESHMKRQMAASAVNPYERAVREAEEWWKSEEQSKLLREIIARAEALGAQHERDALRTETPR